MLNVNVRFLMQDVMLDIIGKYTINVRYADAKIRGSPFHPEVYDPGCVRVTDVSDGMVGRQASFTSLYFTVDILQKQDT